MVFLYPNQMQTAAAPVFPVASSGAAPTPPQPSPMPAAAHMQSGAPMPAQPYPTSMQLQAVMVLSGAFAAAVPEPQQRPARRFLRGGSGGTTSRRDCGAQVLDACGA